MATALQFIALVEDSPIDAILRLKKAATGSASEWAHRKMQAIAAANSLHLPDVLSGKIDKASWEKVKGRTKSVLGFAKDVFMGGGGSASARGART